MRNRKKCVKEKCWYEGEIKEQMIIDINQTILRGVNLWDQKQISRKYLYWLRNTVSPEGGIWGALGGHLTYISYFPQG
jgi:hypothetical protein